MSIKSTLEATRAATFAVTIPNPHQSNFPTPMGTGFFVSPDGLFITAAHVLTVFDPDHRTPIESISAQKERRFEASHPVSQWVSDIELVQFDAANDFALLKASIEKNSDKDWLKDADGFPHLGVASGHLDDGDDVYSFGYPLSTGGVIKSGPDALIGSSELSPRVTSAIVASTRETSGMIVSSGPQQTYVLDKALNYGNSGGPIVATRNGLVHAFCSRFQPVYVPQPHLGEDIRVVVPSLYGVVTSLAYPPIREALATHGVVLHD